MSLEITCPNCQHNNPAGSKFCGNCGDKLPLGTHILCPNCHTPNSRDRVFCDNCGTRLIKDTPLTPDPPEKKKPPSELGGAEPFHLPVRRPGDTGELDPRTLPDWLRTGDFPPVDEGEEAAKEDVPDQPENDSPLPKLEDLTRERSRAGDLPDWLVDDSESDPIIPEQDGITTELFMDLVARSEEDLEEGETFGSGKANLPNWLSEAAKLPDTPSTSETPSATPPPADSGGEADDDWLAVLMGGSDDWNKSSEPDADDEDFFDPQAEAPESPLDEPATDSDQDEPYFEEDEALTQRLADIFDAEESSSGQGLTNWLTSLDGLDDESTGPLEESGEEAGFGVTSWLDELDDKPVTSELADLVPPDDPLQTDDLDWFSAEATEDPLLEEGIPELDSVSTSVTDWLTLPEESEEDEWDEALEADEAADRLNELNPELTKSQLADEIARTVSGDTAVPTEFDALFDFEDEEEEPALPDWLAGAAAEGETFIAEDVSEDDFEDLFAKESLAAQSELDWMMETGALKLPENASDKMDLPEEWNMADDETIGWLADLDAIETGLLNVPDPEQEAATPAPAEGDDDEFDVADLFAEVTMGAEETAVEEQSDDLDEWDSTAEFSSDEPADMEAIPDWIEQLGTVSTELEMDSELPSTEGSEAIPDWLENMRPDDSQVGSSLPDALTRRQEDIDAAFTDIPDDLAGADLPEWLTDEAGDPVISNQLSSQEPAGARELPNWLGGESGAPDAGEKRDEPREIASESSLRSMLEEMSPPEPKSELDEAELPDWVQELKPRETGENPIEVVIEPPSDATIYQEGPLAGLTGVVDIEPVIATLTPTYNPQPLSVSQTQLDQINRLQQLQINVQQPTDASTVSKQPTTDMPLWSRMLITILVTAAVIVGWILPGVIQVQPPTNQTAVLAAYTAVENAANRPVLVAMDFTPSTAGELAPQANLLLEQLAANNSQVTVVTQHPSSTGLAYLYPRLDDSDIHYIPGDAVGLRLLGDCLAGDTPTCTSVLNLTDATALENLALIVILTAERDSLVNWIEQIGTTVDAPLVAGIPQALQPIASPYTATNQLTGVVTGLPGTAVYQQEHTSEVSGYIQQQLAAQTAGQIIALSMLVAAMLLFGIIRPIRRQLRRRKRRRANG